MLYASVAVGVAIPQASAPLFFELASELCFPAPESLTSALLTLSIDLLSIAFFGGLSAFSLVSTSWAVDTAGGALFGWLALGVLLLAIPPVAVLRGRLQRLEIDRKAAGVDTNAEFTLKGKSNKHMLHLNPRDIQIENTVKADDPIWYLYVPN